MPRILPIRYGICGDPPTKARLLASRISPRSVDKIVLRGRGSRSTSCWSPIHLMMATSSARMLRCTPRRIYFSVSVTNHRRSRARALDAVHSGAATRCSAAFYRRLLGRRRTQESRVDRVYAHQRCEWTQHNLTHLLVANYLKLESVLWIHLLRLRDLPRLHLFSRLKTFLRAGKPMRFHFRSSDYP